MHIDGHKSIIAFGTGMCNSSQLLFGEKLTGENAQPARVASVPFEATRDKPVAV